MKITLDNLKAFTLGVLKGSFLNKKNLDKIGETEEGTLQYGGVTYATAQAEERLDVVDNTLSQMSYSAKLNKDGEDEYFYIYGNSTTNASEQTVSIPANENVLKIVATNDSFAKELNNSSNISFDGEFITLKKGFTYKFTMFPGISSSNMGMYLVDSETTSTSSAKWAGVKRYGARIYLGASGYSTAPAVILVDATEEDKIVKLAADRKGTIYPLDFSMLVEIMKPYAVDPVESVNAKNGLEDSPVGHIISYMGNTPPKHYLSCDGSVYNIADYSYLAEHIKNEFGSVNHFGGDGSTTFGVPDLRGEFLRGTGTNSHSNQGNGSKVGTHQNATESPYFGIWGSNRLGTRTARSDTGFELYTNPDTKITASTLTERRYTPYNTTSLNETTAYGYTSRPTNTSVLYCIKYEPTYFMAIEGKDVYSEDEKQIGYWFEKPLYQKTIIVNNKKIANNVTIPHGIENYDMVDVKNALIKDASVSPTRWASSSSGGIGSSSTPLGFRCQGDNIICNTGTDWNAATSRTWYFTIQYTKTTD